MDKIKELQMLAQRSEGFFGDPAGFEEKFFMTVLGECLLLGIGGPKSAYASIRLSALDKTEARAWLTRHAGRNRTELLLGPEHATDKETETRKQLGGAVKDKKVATAKGKETGTTAASSKATVEKSPASAAKISAKKTPARPSKTTARKTPAETKISADVQKKKSPR